jgi:hypothetical protein
LALLKFSVFGWQALLMQAPIQASAFCSIHATATSRAACREITEFHAMIRRAE